MTFKVIFTTVAFTTAVGRGWEWGEGDGGVVVWGSFLTNRWGGEELLRG